MKIMYIVITWCLLTSCSINQNLVRSEVEAGKIPEQTYVDNIDHYLAILLEIEDTEKWKIFYTDFIKTSLL
jgi:hypothetical protein